MYMSEEARGAFGADQHAPSRPDPQATMASHPDSPPSRSPGARLGRLLHNQRRPAEPATTGGREPNHRPDAPGIRRLCLAIGLENYGRWDLDGQRSARHALTDVLVKARTATGLAALDWLSQRYGERELIALPPGIDEREAIQDFVVGLRLALHRANQSRGPFDRMRVRVAIHEGIIEADHSQVTGRGAVMVNNLLDSQPARTALRLNPDADFAVIVSQPIFDEHIGREYRDFDADWFQPHSIDIPARLLSTYAWTWAPVNDHPNDGIPQIKPERSHPDLL